ncbi:N-acetylmuramoyl-L-alanine amidase family protein [Roseicitreum antarcticum]|uniref:N-acetylmuramoyl-L-alanine amidase n=1 Tax=Roseicitreum antarcticum TaxID=564137 RepID=A0A1H2ZY33_9RHOB|nr:N-acetylmuramoyl-L-alanine amidase [Roseicitreum antarcticum]SDX21848.1 N-acetylmuramoyl-L-alanine amidase [Roseicitreum antarcticum]
MQRERSGQVQVQVQVRQQGAGRFELGHALRVALRLAVAHVRNVVRVCAHRGAPCGMSVGARVAPLRACATGCVLASALSMGAAQAQPLGGLARLDVAQSSLSDLPGGGVALDLTLSQPVPYRVRIFDNPPRLALDFDRVDWAASGDVSLLGQASSVTGLHSGVAPVAGDGVGDTARGGPGAGMSRLLITMAGPFGVQSAGMRVADGTGVARIALRLMPVDAARFAQSLSPPEGIAPSAVADVPARAAPLGQRPTVVVLDPGHGGFDPGAERNGVRESDLMLTFARELHDAFIRAGDYRVVLTRAADVFVSLDGRVRAARAAGADVFLSLHADALEEGVATGATVYTLSEDASDAATATLAARHDRADLLAGVDLRHSDDVIANVLMSLARVETAPRTDRLAGAIIGAIGQGGVRLHSHPRQSGAFSVLRAPDIPALLLELGFLSSPRDRANLTDPVWRARVAQAIVAGVGDWLVADIADAERVRR